MENTSLVRTAKTVDEAIELALLELGVGREEVEVDVVSRGRAGILGIGSEPAEVRVSLLSLSNAAAGTALTIVNRLLDAMDVEATSTIRSSGSGPDDPPIIDIVGEDASLIIGRRGETLRALQFIVNIILARQSDSGPVIVDVEQYRQRRQQQVRTLALRMADRAMSDGQPVTLDPMPPADRRVVHVTLADDKGVTTASSGEGAERRVTITPTGERVPRPSPSAGRQGGNRRRQPPRDDRD
jgi:spoIIIJ-associated protein